MKGKSNVVLQKDQILYPEASNNIKRTEGLGAMDASTRDAVILLLQIRVRRLVSSHIIVE